MAAKRYRSAEHRAFRRSAVYTEGRRVRDSREMRAMTKGTSHGRAVAAGQWAVAEWQALHSLWSAGVPVPYPVQIDGTEILMEYVSVDGAALPGSPRRARSQRFATPGSSRCARRWLCSRAGTWHTGTSRPTTSSLPVSDWCSSTCPKSSTSSATRAGWTC
jgi:RIO kinase 1